MNISLMSKWWWTLETEDGLWQTIIKHKYMQNRSIHEVAHRLNDSPMWNDLLKVKDVYLYGRGIKIGCGNLTRFWIDPWLFKVPLCYLNWLRTKE